MHFLFLHLLLLGVFHDLGLTQNVNLDLTGILQFAFDLLSKITGKDQSDFAIMIGEISKTSGSADTMQVMNNNNFIFVQRKLAAELQNTYVIASGQFEINTIENGVNVNGQDAWHWTTEHMFSIGELVGECIVNEILK